MSLPQKEDSRVWDIFVSNEDEMYALESEEYHEEFIMPVWNAGSPAWNRLFEVRYFRRENHIKKYKPESNSWEDISLLNFDKLDSTQNLCIVAKDNFIYFIGGVEQSGDECKFLTDVHRYDLSRNQWDKVADIQEPKMSPCGAVVNGKLFIAGRITQENGMSEMCQCEVYNETTNKWQFIASFNILCKACPKLFSVDGKLYALGIMKWGRGYYKPDPRIQCYDPDKNEWNRKTEIPFRAPLSHILSANAYPVRIFKGFQHVFQHVFQTSRQPLAPTKKCFIM